MAQGQLKIICLILASAFIAVFIFEIFLKAADYSYSPLRIKLLTEGDWRYHHAFEDNNFVYDPYLIWRPKINHSVFNAQGYRGREIAASKQQNEFRILAIGDSNTLGWDQLDGPNWPAYLEDRLQELNEVMSDN